MFRIPRFNDWIYVFLLACYTFLLNLMSCAIFDPCDRHILTAFLFYFTRHESQSLRKNALHIDVMRKTIYNMPFFGKVIYKEDKNLYENYRRILNYFVYPWEIICKNRVIYDVSQCKLWHSRLWSFQGRDTKLERFLAKNQLYSNEITKFWKLE